MSVHADSGLLELTFDRAVDIAAFDGSQITMNDNDGTGQQYVGDAPFLDGANAVAMALVGVGPATGVGLNVSATGSTGIVASDDGTAWAGVTGLALPFTA